MIDKLAWIHLANQRILSTRSKGKEVYYIPGGKREQGESDQEALVREIKEELSVDLEETSIAYLGTFKAQADGHPKGVMVQMTCYTAAYTGTLKAASEIEEMRWLQNSDRDKIAAVDQLIFNYLNEKGSLA